MNSLHCSYLRIMLLVTVSIHVNKRKKSLECLYLVSWSENGACFENDDTPLYSNANNMNYSKLQPNSMRYNQYILHECFMNEQVNMRIFFFI